MSARSSRRTSLFLPLPQCTPANKTADGELRHALHALYPGILYFQNAARFYGTNVNVI